MASLCQQYWQPLYIYARRKGTCQQDAEDLTQGFFAYILSKEFFAKAAPERGRLRTLLLKSFQNFTINEWKKRSAEKRGGRVALLSIDAEPAEAWLQVAPESGTSPELEFERSWARENLCVDHTAPGRTRAQVIFRELIDEALGLGGSYYLTYHGFARADQIKRGHPNIPQFLRMKRRYDPKARFQSRWWRHCDRLLGE